jgi:hypothetical protein
MHGMASERQRRRRAKLARQAAPAARPGAPPAHVLEAVREAFARALSDAEHDQPGRAQVRAPSVRRPRPEQLSVAEAAAALGIHPSTLRRRAGAGALTLTRQPYTGQLVVSRAELERHAHRHRPARGRPPALSDDLLARMLALRRQGMSLPRIGALLEREGVPTAHGGVRWWPSAVQAALRRAGAS